MRVIMNGSNYCNVRVNVILKLNLKMYDLKNKMDHTLDNSFCTW